MEQLFFTHLASYWVIVIFLGVLFLFVLILWNSARAEQRDYMFQRLAKDLSGEVTIDRNSIAPGYLIDSFTPLRTVRIKILNKLLVIQDGVEPTWPGSWRGTYQQYLRYRDSVPSALFNGPRNDSAMRNTTKFFWDTNSASAQFLSSNIRLATEEEIRTFAQQARQASSPEGVRALPYNQFGIEFWYAMLGVGMLALIVFWFM